jgi:hypothetical protein
LRSSAARWQAWGFLLAGFALATPVMGQPIANENALSVARRHFNQGVALFSDGNVEAALLEFRASYQARRHPGVLYNIGVAERSLHRYAEAIASFRQYLAETDDSEGTMDVRAEAARAIDELLAVIARVSLTVSPPGADVFLDGRLVGRSPLAEAVLVAAGEREIEIRCDGYRTHRSVLEVRGRQQVEKVIELEPLVDDAVQSSARTSTPWFRRWWVWTIAGVVVAGAVAAAIAVPLTSGPDEIQFDSVQITAHEGSR